MVAPWQVGKDELNILRYRNANNTADDEYNCGGHALETFNIYLPFETEGENREMMHYCLNQNMPHHLLTRLERFGKTSLSYT